MRAISALWRQDHTSPILREFLALVRTIKDDAQLETSD